MRYLALLLLFALALPAFAQPDEIPFSREIPRLIERDLSGPRIGLTWVPGNSELSQRLDAEGMDPWISQFGWHFENRVNPVGGGPAFVVETIPLISGVEYGKFVPGVTLAMGLRFENGVEFGLGPNVILTKDDGAADLTTSLVIAGGRTLDFNGVSIPLNLALATSPDGQRLSFVFGYALTRSARVRGR